LAIRLIVGIKGNVTADLGLMPQGYKKELVLKAFMLLKVNYNALK